MREELLGSITGSHTRLVIGIVMFLITWRVFLRHHLHILVLLILMEASVLGVLVALSCHFQYS